MRRLEFRLHDRVMSLEFYSLCTGCNVVLLEGSPCRTCMKFTLLCMHKTYACVNNSLFVTIFTVHVLSALLLIVLNANDSNNMEIVE